MEHFYEYLNFWTQGLVLPGHQLRGADGRAALAEGHPQAGPAPHRPASAHGIRSWGRVPPCPGCAAPAGLLTVVWAVPDTCPAPEAHDCHCSVPSPSHSSDEDTDTHVCSLRPGPSSPPAPGCPAVSRPQRAQGRGASILVNAGGTLSCRWFTGAAASAAGRARASGAASRMHGGR